MSLFWLSGISVRHIIKNVFTVSAHFNLRDAW